MRKFVITGCGRSGTTYIFNLLSNIGCECRQEEYYASLIKKGPLFYSLKHKYKLKLLNAVWDTNYQGEAAWQAVPYLGYLPKSVIVFHQIRHPMMYIRSRQKKGLVSGPFRQKYCQIDISTVNEREFFILPLEDQVNYLTEFWIKWNLMVEERVKIHKNTYFRYKIEDVDKDLILKLMDMVGFKVDTVKLEQEFSTLPKNIHSRGSSNQSINWQMVKPSLLEQVKQLSGKYGYNIEKF